MSYLHPFPRDLYGLIMFSSKAIAQPLCRFLFNRGVAAWPDHWRELFLPSADINMESQPQQREDLLIAVRGMSCCACENGRCGSRTDDAIDPRAQPVSDVSACGYLSKRSCRATITRSVQVDEALVFFLCVFSGLCACCTHRSANDNQGLSLFVSRWFQWQVLLA